MASSISETQIVAGDIFFQSGMYKKKLNVKTASNVSYTEDIIDLTQYSEGETWSNVTLVYSIVEIDLRQSEDVRSYTVKPKYLTDNKNSFKFVAEINGKNVNNRVVVSWFAREEVIDIQGEKFITKESYKQEQVYTYNLQNKARSILSVTSDNGSVTSYMLDGTGTKLTVDLGNGTVYKTYIKPYTYKETGKPGSYSPSSTHTISEHIYYNSNLGSMPFTGVLNLSSNVEKPQAWQISAEKVYVSNVSKSIATGTEYQIAKTADMESKYVITRSVLTSTDSWAPYTQHWTIYCQEYRRTILRDCTWTGTVYAQTYLYLVNLSYIIYEEMIKIIEDTVGTWVKISSEELVQTTNTPPKVGQYIQQTWYAADYFRYYITKVVPISQDKYFPYYTTYNVYGIKEMKVYTSG